VVDNSQGSDFITFRFENGLGRGIHITKIIASGVSGDIAQVSCINEISINEGFYIGNGGRENMILNCPQTPSTIWLAQGKKYLV